MHQQYLIEPRAEKVELKVYILIYLRIAVNRDYW